MALSNFEGLLDWDKLGPWIESQDLPGKGPVTAVEQLTGGSQNNIFMLTRGGEKMVLRRPPRHLRGNSNDTMLREARVLKAIAGSKVAHPRFFGVCADTSVIGATFYLMAPIDGFTPRAQLPGQYATDASWRKEMGFEFVRTAAALSNVDYKAVGLEGFGKPDNWHARQVDRWRSQLESYNQMPNYKGAEVPHVAAVGKWLTDNAPKSGGRVGIIHGDFQFANVMFAHNAPKIVAAVDWELSTLGDPMLDLAWVMTAWREDGDPDGRETSVIPWDGFVSRADLIKLYGELTGRDMSIAPWMFVLACYKLGIILEGSWARAQSGQAPMEIGKRLHDVTVWLFNKARQLI